MSSYTVSSLCQEFCSGESSQDAPRILARDIQSEKTDLLSVVEALGVYLTSSAVDVRCQGTRLLSELLSNLHSYQLPQDDVHYLASFYCDRFRDRAAVLPYVLRGLHAMVVHQSICSDDVVTISRAIFNEVPNQSLPQGERRLLYTIMDYFLSDHTESVKKMGSEFVLGYIQAMDGEKDPRNLVIALNSVHRIILHLPFEVLAEDLFEVTSCYFPIDFTPPPDDPHAISKEQLVLALRKCLTSSPKFAEFCLPLMLEKVSSDLLSAKLDSLLTIAVGCVVFGMKGLYTYLQPLWIAIRKEVFQTVSQEVEAAGMQCLTAMSKALSPPLLPGSRAGGGRELREFTDMVLKDCRHHLVEQELSLLSPASHLLQAVAMGCDQACSAITSVSIPLLLEQFHKRSMVSQRKALLQVLLEFVNIVKMFSQEDVVSPLAPHKADLVSLVVPVIRGREQRLVVVGLDLCRGVLTLPGYLGHKEVPLLAEHVQSLALSHSDASVRDRASRCLECVAWCYPHITRDTILPPLLQLFTLNPPLPMETDEQDPQSQSSGLPNTASLLTSLSVSLDLQVLILPPFLTILEQLAEQAFTQMPANITEAVTKSLCRVVKRTVETPEGVSVVHETVVSRILLLCVAPSLKSPSAPTRHVFTEEAVLSHCLSLLKTFTLAANSDHRMSESWASLLHQLFLENKFPLLPDISSFLPLDPSSPVQQTHLVSVLTSTVGAMTKEIACTQAFTFLPRLLEQATHCPDEWSSSQSAMCCASIVNKMKGDRLDQFIGSDMKRLWQAISDDVIGDHEIQCRSLTTWIWITKALVVRSHPRGRDGALKLFDLFGDSHLSRFAADGFSLILRNSKEILNTECNAIIRLMHKQQFFVEVVPELVKRFGEAPLDRRQYFLRALAHIMHSVPKQVLLGELPSLLPLLMESLESEEAGLSQSTLEGLHSLIQDAPGTMSNHMTTLIPRFLALAVTPSSMKTRQSALACLNALSQLPRHLVFPYQSQVLQVLVPCLDDKKRLVRREAVNTRANWFLMNAV